MRQRAEREEALHRELTFMVNRMRLTYHGIRYPPFPSEEEYAAYVAWPTYPGDQDTTQGGTEDMEDMAVDAPVISAAAPDDERGDDEDGKGELCQHGKAELVLLLPFLGMCRVGLPLVIKLIVPVVLVIIHACHLLPFLLSCVF